MEENLINIFEKLSLNANVAVFEAIKQYDSLKLTIDDDSRILLLSIIRNSLHFDVQKVYLEVKLDNQPDFVKEHVKNVDFEKLENVHLEYFDSQIKN